MKREELAGDGFSISLEVRPLYLRALVHGGRDSLEVSMAYWQALHEACTRHAAGRLLVVEDLVPWHASEADFTRLMDMGAALGLGQVQIAYTSPRSPMHVNEMGVIVGLERGMWLRLFASEHDAQVWLEFGA